jgi:hypothetical protein
VNDLRDNLARRGASVDSDSWTVYLAYSNLCGRAWQFRQGPSLLGNPNAPEIFRKPLARRILSTRQNSNQLTAPKAR